MKKPLGIYVEHRHRKTNWLYVVPIFKIPYLGPDGHPKAQLCNLCRTAHACKTIHLDLVEGRAIVSQGVLDTLRLAGLPSLDITGTTKNPPPLAVATGTSRPAQNSANRSILIWKRYKPKEASIAAT